MKTSTHLIESLDLLVVPADCLYVERSKPASKSQLNYSL